MDDDWVKWRADTPGIVQMQRDAGFRTVKVMFPWRPGMRSPGRVEQHYMERIARMSALRQHVVLAFSGPGRKPPRTRGTRDQFCGYVGSVLAGLPMVKDVVIWNEVNSPSFWRPQRNAPAEYAALLGRCWDVLHALRPGVNVISSTAPRHAPGAFVRKLGGAYAVSGRTRPLVDTFGHNPYPLKAAEPPTAVHADGYIGQGDYGALVSVLRSAFGGTAQPVPGEGEVTIWYLEDGFQTRVPFGRRRFYTGRETELEPVPALAPPFGSGVDQARQLREAIALAYCQPAIGAFFNFQLADEKRLAGWQSGLLWANWQPKPSQEPIKGVLDAVRSDQIVCG